ncbi:MAG: hypothetical protein ABI954_09140 [Pyrinomonadaceae bacterium]
MKTLLVLFLALTIGLGELTIVYFQAEAKKLIDDRAQALLQQARTAIGGDDAINAVNNLIGTGKISHKIRTPDNQERTLEGDVEIALETTGRIHKKVKLTFQGDSDGANPATGNVKKFIVENDKTMILRHPADESGEPGQELRVMGDEQGQKIIKRFDERNVRNQQNEFAQLMLGLLLKSSSSSQLVFNYLGEGDVDGTAAEIIEATGGDNLKTKLYLDKQSHLPLMVSYRGINPHPVFIFHSKDGATGNGQEVKKVIVVRTPEGEKTVENTDDNKVFVRKTDKNVLINSADDASLPFKTMEEVEIQIRFSDFRQEGGLMLPHKLTQYVNGQLDETTTIESYEINAANLSERFKDEVRIMKKQ